MTDERRAHPGSDSPAPAAGDGVVIQMENLSRIFTMGDTEVRAVDGISLTIQAGEFVAVIGASGSGKSTLMNLTGCLDTPTGGSYRLRNQWVSRMADDELAEVRNREIGFVFQTFNLLSRLTARENVELPLIYARVPPRERKERALAMLKTVGLGDRSTHRPNQLSGGQRQRVAIARALIHKPSLILADEPTGNLDSETTQEILALFDDLHRQGNTIMMVTHDPTIAARAPRTVRMLDGKIVEETTRAA